MHILEKFILGKENNPLTCEDGIFFGEKLIAVIDGVTTDGGRLWDGHKSGYFAKEVLLDCLQDLAKKQMEEVCLQELAKEQMAGNCPQEQEAARFIEKLDGALYSAVALNGDKDLLPEEYPRASIILYNDVTKEIISYGDCQCSINGVVHRECKKIDELNAALRAYHLEYHLQQGRLPEELAEKDPGRTAILENLRMQCTFENKAGEFGYAVLNGRGVEPSLIRVYKVCPGDEVILASDGYPELGRSLEESEAVLEQILREDPLCFRRYRSTKGVKAGNISFDDRTFCRFIV